MFCEAVGEAQDLTGAMRAATMLDLGHLVYVSVACLRLIQTYVCEVYPSLGASLWLLWGVCCTQLCSLTVITPSLSMITGQLTLDVTNKYHL